MNTKIQELLKKLRESESTNNVLLQNRNTLIILTQLLLSAFSYVAAYNIRFDFAIPGKELAVFYKCLPLLLISRIVTYYFFKIHAGSWRFVSMQDLIDTFKAVLSGSLLFLTLMVFVYRIEEFPRSIFILEGIINLMVIGGSRFIIRYYSELKNTKATKILKYVLIVGAGKAGVMILNEIKNNSQLGIHAVGFVDDDPYKKGIHIQGTPILGNTLDIPQLAKKFSVDEVFIAIPSSSYKDIVRITNIAQEAQLKIRVLPNLGKLIEGKAITSQLKDVAYDDLLGRKIIKFCRESDRKHMESEIKGKAVLVTGAGGSIGSELCRQVAEYKPRTLILYDRYENTLYDLELDIRKEFPGLSIFPVIGDILDEEKVNGILQRHAVELIYHAAAYKHVPLMEREPIEAVRNNVLGTMNLAKLAAKNNVGKFVLISTDKAVNPANVMGTTKRIAELTVQSMNAEQTKFIAVRFGNVIGSNGSVIPLFKKQIAKGGPITVTHPDVTRYFMAIPEAVQLVMTAGAMGKGGEIFLLDMGEPIKIVDLAHELVRLSGLEPGKDIDIVFSGLRPGEKLSEDLYWKGEGIIPTQNKKITMLKQNGTGPLDLMGKINQMNASIQKNDAKEILRLLKDVVPESTIKEAAMISQITTDNVS